MNNQKIESKTLQKYKHRNTSICKGQGKFSHMALRIDAVTVHYKYDQSSGHDVKANGYIGVTCIDTHPPTRKNWSMVHAAFI